MSRFVSSRSPAFLKAGLLSGAFGQENSSNTRAAKSEHRIEECFQRGKSEAGLIFGLRLNQPVANLLLQADLFGLHAAVTQRAV